MKVKLIVIYVLNIIDLIATMLLVKRFGVQIEGNPIGKWLIETNLVVCENCYHWGCIVGFI